MTDLVTIVEKFAYDVFSQGKLDVIDEIIAPSYVGYWAGWGEVKGREQLKNSVEEWRSSFPDWRAEIEQIAVDGDTVAFRLTGRGTFLGPIGDIEPTGESVEIAEMAILLVVGGMVVSHWEMTDTWSIEHQLGIRLPKPESRPGW